jgi:GR25 family glycosyltransferase involved in LPS biosynthesis
MINAFVIRVNGDTLAERARLKLENSLPTNIVLQTFDAITPDDVDAMMKKHKVTWNYPWYNEEIDLATGLIKKAYPGADPKKRMACFMSHYIMWHNCAKVYKSPLIIHEHDAIYYSDESLPIVDFVNSKYDIIGLNDPRGATRLHQVYDRVVQDSPGDIVRAPSIDQQMVPQGIAGNSSYYIEPSGAEKLMDLTRKYGAWPNDALMCRQLIGTLGQTKKYYTYVQGLQSTTST